MFCLGLRCQDPQSCRNREWQGDVGPVSWGEKHPDSAWKTRDLNPVKNCWSKIFFPVIPIGKIEAGYLFSWNSFECK